MVTFFTYDSTVRVEDVRDLITNVSIRKTPFVSSIGLAQADDTEHKVLIDSYSSSGDNAGVEGTDPTYPALTDPTKVINITQIMRKPFRISFSKLNVKYHGMSDNWAYQKVKQTVALKKDLELAALFGTKASGTGSAARRMDGLVVSITSYKDGSTYTGEQLTASIFNAISAAIWDQSESLGGIALLGSYQKRRVSENFSSFDSAARRTIAAGDRKVEIPIDTIVADFGTYEVMASHEMQSVIPSAVIVYQPEFHKLAYLPNSSPQAVEYAATGLARKGEVWLQTTLEVHNQLVDGMVLNLATS